MKRQDGHRALTIEFIYRAKAPRRLIRRRSGYGANWRQYRLFSRWHVKFVWHSATKTSEA